MYNAPDWLARRAALSPQRVALIDALNGHRRITYLEWNRQANRTARFFQQELGLVKGDRLAVLSKNCVEYLDCWFALGKLGGILQNLNWRLTALDLAALVRDARPKALVYAPEFSTLAQELLALLPPDAPAGWTSAYMPHPAAPATLSSLQLVRLGPPGLDSLPGELSFSTRQAYPDSALPSTPLSPEDPWVICYTGGTTGTPKGALLSHRAITANAINTIISWGLSPDDVTILNSPLFHSGGLNVFTAPLIYLGGASIVCKEFDLEQTFDLLEHGLPGGIDVTIWFGVPTMFVMMQNHSRWPQADFSRLKILISGGAPCPLPIFERFWEKGVDFKTGYGLTEAGPNTFWLPPEQVHSKPGAVGYPLFHVEVRVVDEQGADCGPDQVGELLVRGPHLFSGYWNNPEASAQAVRDGWLHTGDLAAYDADGCFRIMGRLKDMIISGGENVYPAEVESVLHSHPAIAEAALIGVPDEKWGEVGWAVVVLQPGAQADPELLRDFCRARLARYKVPARVLFVEDLPKTGANKVDKKLLQERYWPASGSH